MKFTKQIRLGEEFWFSGIYKISCYTWFRGYDCDQYYHVYLIQPGCKNWGDYVGGKAAQYDKKLTFDKCVSLCEKHANDYDPLPSQIKQASIAQQTWCD